MQLYQQLAHGQIAVPQRIEFVTNQGQLSGFYPFSGNLLCKQSLQIGERSAALVYALCDFVMVGLPLMGGLDLRDDLLLGFPRGEGVQIGQYNILIFLADLVLGPDQQQILLQGHCPILLKGRTSSPLTVSRISHAVNIIPAIVK
jgi:hypothetical protein